MPAVSVIVPVYNVENYLCRCIDSILCQSFTDFELILVDDGSPDNSGAICDEYAEKDRRVIVIHKENGGVSSARNAGLDIALGTYVAFCDSDDWWDEDFLLEMHGAILQSEADVVVSNFRTIDANDSIVSNTNHVVEINVVETLDDKYDYLINILARKTGWEIWRRLFKKKIIQMHGIKFCTNCKNYGEDLGFVLEYALFSNRQQTISYCGYNYFLRDGSMMSNSRYCVKLDQMNELSRWFYDRYEVVFLSRRYIRKYAVIHFLILRIEIQKIVGTPYYKELKKEMAKIEKLEWCIDNLRHIWSCYTILKDRFGRRAAQQILLLSHYTVHQNWTRFIYESAIAYKFFIKG